MASAPKRICIDQHFKPVVRQQAMAGKVPLPARKVLGSIINKQLKTKTPSNKRTSHVIIIKDDDDDDNNDGQDKEEDDNIEGNNNGNGDNDDDDNYQLANVVDSNNIDELDDSSQRTEIVGVRDIERVQSQDTLDADDFNRRLSTSSPKTLIDFFDPFSYYEPPKGIEDWPGIIDFDRTQIKPGETGSYGEPHYAWDIFISDREREKLFVTKKYLTTATLFVSEKSPKINAKMRAILVDWMVQVQDGFALNHEVLYNAVKIVDQYLMRKLVAKENLQLLGLVALLIASKLDERLPPEIDEFIDNTKQAYTKKEVILFEIEVLRTLNFYISYPLSYRFLRRYARCISCDMKALTLARYILELSLIEYNFIDLLESKISAAALLLALKIRAGSITAFVWTKTAEFYTMYKEDELHKIMIDLNSMLAKPIDLRISAIKTKYLNQVFLRVASVAPLTI